MVRYVSRKGSQPVRSPTPHMYRLLGAARVSPSPSDTANRPEKLAREPKQRASCVKRARQNGRAQTGVEPGGD